MKFVKPARLKRGDTVAVVSLSWGGPSVFPHIFDEGLRVLKEDFGLKIKEYPTARMDADKLYKNPELRADDINKAFADKEVKAIISSIGGNDSVRILKYLDKKVIRENPKIIMGYSDASTYLSYINQLGLVTFQGPAVMAGFSQTEKLPKEFSEHVKKILFTNFDEYKYKPYKTYHEGYPEWANEENTGGLKETKENDGWHWLQGDSVTKGELFGGNIEVFEFFKGTDFYPKPSFWEGKILFFETSEEKPPVRNVKYMLRNYGVQGVFEKIEGLLFGRARDYSDEEKKELDETLVSIVRDEFGVSKLPIISNMDFGHTDPQFILPLGIEAKIDCNAKTFKLLESPTSE